MEILAKTRLGIAVFAVGMAIYQTVDLCPIASWVPWIKWVGAIIAILGGGQAMLGLNKKVNQVVDNQKTMLPVISNLQTPPASCDLQETKEEEKPLTEKRLLEILRAAKVKRDLPK